MNEEKKNKKLGLVLIIVIIILLITGVTYALVSYLLEGNTENNINYNLSLTYTEQETGVVVNDLVPMDDSKGINNGYSVDFSVSGSSSAKTNLYYYVYLSINEYTGFDLNGVKFYLTDLTANKVVGPSTIADFKEKDASKKEYYVYQNRFALKNGSLNQTHEYNMKFWVNGSALHPSVDVNGKEQITEISYGTFTFKINVETGRFYIDEGKPLIERNGNSSATLVNTSSSFTIPLKITEDYVEIVPSDFTIDDIAVEVGGATITPTKKILTYNSVTDGVYSYTLTLGGVSGNGALNLNIAANAIADTDGNYSDSTKITSGITVDNIAPTCKYKGESTTWTNGNRTISVDCQDNTGGSACQSLSNLSETYTSTIKTAKFTKTIKDNAGNETVCEKTANIYVDKEKPAIAKNGNASATLVNASSSFTIPLKITEQHSGINTGDFTASDILVKVGGTTIAPTTTKSLTYNSVSNGVYSYTFTLAGVSGNGALTLEIPASSISDKAGNNNTVTTINPSITVDTTAPSAWVNISGTAYGSGYRSGATASVGCSDTNGISSTWIADNTGDGNASSISLISRSCSRSVTVTCVDAVGNSSSSTRTVPIYASVATGKYSCSCNCWNSNYAGYVARSNSNTGYSSCASFCNAVMGYGAYNGSCTKKYTMSC